MISKERIQDVVNLWLEGKEYFLVDVQVSEDNRITVEIDQKDGVWMDDCVELSRFIDSQLNRDEEDYDLEVGSSGIGQPMKVLRQVQNCIGKEVEVKMADGRKLAGILKEADEGQVAVTVTEKVKEEGMKRAKMMKRDVVLNRAEMDYIKQIIKIK